MTPTVLIHVQHLLGIGHLKRAAAIAGALRARGVHVVLASGGVPVPQVEDAIAREGVVVTRLPTARAADVHFSQVLDEAGRPIDDAWQARRRDVLLRLFTETVPDAIVTEMYPFGRRAFRFELLPLLEAAKACAKPPVIASSVRDILVNKAKPGRAEEIAALVRRCYDLVLVHGDPNLIRFDETFPQTPAIADRIRYTGYVTDRSIVAGAADRANGEVLISAGGGAVGFALLKAAIAARPLSREGRRPWRLITGGNLPEAEAAELAEAAARQQGLVLERFRSDFTDLLGRCRVSVSQGGYNTVLEILATRTPAVIVPFAEGEESEQTDRARLLADKGLLHLLPQGTLTPQRLAAAIDAATPPPVLAIDLAGAARTAELILQSIEARR